MVNRYKVPRGQSPIKFVAQTDRRILEVFHSLPLSSRTPDEVLYDHAIEFAFQASQNRSLLRRKPRRYESELIVRILDELSDTTDAIGERATSMALRHINLLEETKQRS